MIQSNQNLSQAQTQQQQQLEAVLIQQNEGSLLRLFQSEYFTTEMLIEYFHKNFNKEAIHEYLINKLYQTPDKELEFYITQLIYMVIKKKSTLLENFITDKCAQNRILFLLIYWSLQAYGDALKFKDDQSFQKIDKLERVIEMAHVNGQIHLMQQYIDNSENTQTEAYQQEILDLFLEKSNRAVYNDGINKFINNLIKISLTLKPIPIEDRKQKLKQYVKKANAWIKKLRENNKNISYFHGLIFPFQSVFNSKANSNYIVNILEQELACFNTKMRVPYKIVVETIDIEDLKHYNIRATKVSKTSTSDIEDFDVDDEVDESIFTDNDKYQGFASWAKSKTKEEQNNKKKKNKNKMNLQPNSEMKLSEYHKMMLHQQEALKNVSNSSQQQKSNIQLIDHIKDPKRLEKFQENLEKFNNQFEEKKDILYHRRNSCIGSFETYLPKEKEINVNTNNNKKLPNKKANSTIKRRYSVRDFRVKEILSFFTDLRYNYPEKREYINQIYDYLHYDVIEKKIHRHIIEDQQIQTLIIPKKFGYFGELWEDRKGIYQNESPYGHFPSYQLRCLIIKGNDDLRQEWLVMQLISKFDDIFRSAKLPLQLRPYEIIVTSHNSGIIEMIPDSLSVDQLKKRLKGENLYYFFTEQFKYTFEEAQRNFIESLAAYCIVTYLLQIKDRHNGNILIDSDGRIIHIDFGFVFNTSPGGNINFESAPFKLTIEYVDVMGGKNSDMYRYFKNCLVRGFMELKKHVHTIVYFVQIMAEQSDLACLQNFNSLEFRQRFLENSTDEEYMQYVDKLVEQSYDNWRTNQYDNFQKITNGYMP